MPHYPFLPCLVFHTDWCQGAAVCERTSRLMQIVSLVMLSMSSASRHAFHYLQREKLCIILVQHFVWCCWLYYHHQWHALLQDKTVQPLLLQ